MYSTPSPTGDNGRDAKGHFVPGNKAAKGNPHARRVQRLRSELLRAVKPADLRAIVAAVVAKAKAGDMAVVHELFDRTLGKPVHFGAVWLPTGRAPRDHTIAVGR